MLSTVLTIIDFKQAGASELESAVQTANSLCDEIGPEKSNAKNAILSFLAGPGRILFDMARDALEERQGEIENQKTLEAKADEVKKLKAMVEPLACLDTLQDLIEYSKGIKEKKKSGKG